MKNIIKNSRKGVSLVELVIALAVIMIITAASISMIHSSIKIEVRAASIIEANNAAESIVEMYRFSNNFDETNNYNQEKFEELLGKFIGINGKKGKEINNDSQEYDLYILNKGAYNIKINYYTDKIEINAFHSDDTQIYNEPIIIFKGK